MCVIGLEPAEVWRESRHKAEGRHPLYQAALDADADFHKEVTRQFGPKRAGTMRYKSDSHDEKTVAARDKKRAADATWLAHIEKDRIYKSESILNAARVDAEVERRLAAIEGAREGLGKADTAVTTPIAKSESDHVKEFVLGLDLGGTRRWHSACVSKDDSNLGRAVKGRQADRTCKPEDGWRDAVAGLVNRRL